jgi:hypothetical protein
MPPHWPSSDDWSLWRFHRFDSEIGIGGDVPVEGEDIATRIAQTSQSQYAFRLPLILRAPHVIRKPDSGRAVHLHVHSIEFRGLLTFSGTSSPFKRHARAAIGFPWTCSWSSRTVLETEPGNSVVTAHD